MPSFADDWKDTLVQKLLVAAIAAATLWDFRVFDLRIFDGLSIILIGISFFLRPEPIDGYFKRRFDWWLLFAVVALYAIAGYILIEHKSSPAILFLAALGVLVAGRHDWLRLVGPFLWTIAGIHIAFFLVQFFSFYIFGLVIDFQTIVGNTARIMPSAHHMRAAGLFQEPNSYCLNLFLIASIAILWRPRRIYVVIAALSVVLSESIWGLAAAVLLLFLNEARIDRPLKHHVMALVASIAIITVMFNFYLLSHRSTNYNLPPFYLRIESILTDPSLRERFIKNTCSVAENATRDTSATKTVVEFLFGHGLATKYFENCLPANGISFLLKSFGAIGLIALLAGFARVLRGLTFGAKSYAAFAIAFSLTSYPLVTYLIFWLWIPIMTGLLRRDDSKTDLLAARGPEVTSSNVRIIE